MEPLKLKCPAKTNLFLTIQRKRSDGFHEIATLIQALSLFDELTLASANKDIFTCSDSSLIKGNLVLKARDLFRKQLGKHLPVAIALKKHIPTQAGLGGGSSNAAAALWGLNQLHGTPFSDEELAAMGGELGSDVPFFLSLGSALCTGRGEQIEFLEIPPLEFTLIKPPFGLSTPKVYQALQLDQLDKRNTEKEVELWKKGEGIPFNHLEGAAFSISPELAGLKASLIEGGASQVFLSGSGSSLVATGPVNADALKGCQIFSASSVNRKRGTWYS